MADFQIAIDFVIVNEGGYINNSLDHGGPTKYGITLQTLMKWRNKSCSALDVMNLTIVEAKQIYEAYFWDPLKISSLPQSMATAILDVSVNEGQYSAIKLAQMALGPLITPDGVMGIETLKTLGLTDPRKFQLSYVKEIHERYVKIVMNTPNQIQFLPGWLSRSLRLLELV